MEASTRAYSRSGSSETASNNRGQTSAFTQSRKRVKTLFQCPNRGGRSRHGLPVRAIHSTASTNRRLFLPLRPGSPGLPRQSGSIFAHWASVRTKRSIRGVNHSPVRMRTPESQQALERKAQSVRDAGYHQPLREPEYGVEHLHDRLDIGWPVGRSNSIILDSIEGRN